MNRLKDLFGPEELGRCEGLAAGMKEAIFDRHSVSSMGDLDERARITIAVEADEPEERDEIRAIVARAVGADHANVETEDAGGAVVLAEVWLASDATPWPLAAVGLLDAANDALRGRKRKASLRF